MSNVTYLGTLVIFWSEICVNYSPHLNNFSEMPLEESEVLLQHFISAEQPDKLGLVVGLWVSNLVSVWAFKYDATFYIFIWIYIYTISAGDLFCLLQPQKIQIYWPTSGSHSASQCERFQKKKKRKKKNSHAALELVLVFWWYFIIMFTVPVTVAISLLLFFGSSLRWHTWCQATASFLSSRGRMGSFSLHSCFNAVHEVHTGQYLWKMAAPPGTMGKPI